MNLKPGHWLFVLFVAAIGNAQELKKAQLEVKSLICSSCAETITGALKKAPGVTGVEVDQKNKLVQVTFDSQKTDPQKLAQLVDDTGYPAKVVPGGN